MVLLFKPRFVPIMIGITMLGAHVFTYGRHLVLSKPKYVCFKITTREQFENGSIALFWKSNEKERVVYVNYKVADRGNGSPTMCAVWCTETGYEFTVEGY